MCVHVYTCVHCTYEHMHMHVWVCTCVWVCMCVLMVAEVQVTYNLPPQPLPTARDFQLCARWQALSTLPSDQEGTRTPLGPLVFLLELFLFLLFFKDLF